jgi:hypothetical protein
MRHSSKSCIVRDDPGSPWLLFLLPLLLLFCISVVYSIAHLHCTATRVYMWLLASDMTPILYPFARRPIETCVIGLVSK